MSSNIVITKQNGEKEPFDRSKLEQSLRRSGAKEDRVQKVADKVEKMLKPGMSTSKIYGKAFSFLKKEQRSAAARYSLQRAILDFGPTGYPFEWLVKELYSSMGYGSKARKRIEGACVTHELDVVACGEEECLGIEVKFHNDMGIKSDLQTALYVKARFEDIKISSAKKENDLEKPLTQGVLVTNTKFSGSAIEYAECAGLKLLGWNHPREKNLQDVIEEAGMHPITALTSLSEKQKKKLLKDDIVLCKMVISDDALLERYGIKGKRAREAREEIEGLYKSKK